MLRGSLLEHELVLLGVPAVDIELRVIEPVGEEVQERRSMQEVSTLPANFKKTFTEFILYKRMFR